MAVFNLGNEFRVKNVASFADSLYGLLTNHFKIFLPTGNKKHLTVTDVGGRGSGIKSQAAMDEVIHRRATK